MFANRQAIAALVMADKSATQEEKRCALRIVESRCGVGEMSGDWTRHALVVSMSEAARALGYKSTHSVYRAIRAGVLDGFYGGASRMRATGVTAESLRRATGKNNG